MTKWICSFNSLARRLIVNVFFVPRTRNVYKCPIDFCSRFRSGGWRHEEVAVRQPDTPSCSQKWAEPSVLFSSPQFCRTWQFVQNAAELKALDKALAHGTHQERAQLVLPALPSLPAATPENKLFSDVSSDRLIGRKIFRCKNAGSSQSLPNICSLWWENAFYDVLLWTHECFSPWM